MTSTGMESATNTDGKRRIGIREAAAILDRAPATLREWERAGKLPQHLRPSRDEREWRYWTPEQIEEIRTVWMPEHAVPGQGLVEALRARGITTPLAAPTEEQIQRSLEGQRQPRTAAA